MLEQAEMPLVGLMMPMRCRDGFDSDAMARGSAMKATDGRFDIAPGVAWTSLLPYTFNLLWAGFLNMRRDRPVKYVAMIHDDIRPQDGWLDVLVDELERTNADMVSAVVPIKDNRGITSTGVDDTGDEWNPRRLSMTEVFMLPETFGDADLGFPVLLNTGLWVARFDRPWVENVNFRQGDKIECINGQWVPQTRPEDWDFSRQLRSHGCKLMATRKVRLTHERAEWHNTAPWGKWQSDEDTGKPLAVLAHKVKNGLVKPATAMDLKQLQAAVRPLAG